ncbi:PaaI family thioesterase [Aquisalimonas sp.]|uniref:PaaI family thioesterase n=1 Tax=unclassified Aquisalimonas TaxID=2644645 RepID=UPI0025C5A484|nr:PaaI family thioesterase [Aquisalimonas sp.]
MTSPAITQRLLDAVADPLHPGLEIEVAERGLVTVYLPLNDGFIGNPWSGYVHGGVITTLLDKTTRAAALVWVEAGEAVLPLDLRIDHLAATTASAGLLARGRCTRLTATIAFVHGEVVDVLSGDVVANGVSSVLRTPEEAGA